MLDQDDAVRRETELLGEQPDDLMRLLTGNRLFRRDYKLPNGVSALPARGVFTPIAHVRFGPTKDFDVVIFVAAEEVFA